MTDSLKVMHSLVACESLQDFVNRRYDVGDVTRCKLLTRGLNDTYQLDTERDKFILRVYRASWRSKAMIDYELAVLDYLSRNGVTVSNPVKSNLGQLTTEIMAPEGVRYVTLFTYANGVPPRLNEEISYQYGQTVANIHNFTDTFASPNSRFHLDFNHLLDEPLEIIRPAMIEYEADISYVESWIHRIKQNVPASFINYGFCHGDFHDWNVHWQDGNLTVFDFDCCGHCQRWRLCLSHGSWRHAEYGLRVYM